MKDYYYNVQVHVEFVRINSIICHKTVMEE